jgi:UDP-N-acetylglucosamine 2-epimerase (non-hydrolysing)
MPLKLLLVAGARPNFMKVAPLLWEIQKRDDVDAFLVHTGQHYDERMSQRFFSELDIPAPDANLEVGSGSHAVQTAEVMKRFEPVLLEQKPDVVLVVGDVNSTLACALTAVKLNIPVAHVEAGLRSFDRTMPEEINRILTDAISNWLFVSEPSGLANLTNENVPDERVHHVGNVMIDTLIACKPRIAESRVLDAVGVVPGSYAVLTMHRPANVDRPEVFADLMGAITFLQNEIPFVFPVHPRTRKAIDDFVGAPLPNLVFTEALGYLDFMKLISDARFVLTDSGGVQEETTFLGVPCLTMRENTERPVTVTQGTNRLVGLDPEKIVTEAMRTLEGNAGTHLTPELWDGRASERIIDELAGRRVLPIAPPHHKSMTRACTTE